MRLFLCVDSKNWCKSNLKHIGEHHNCTGGNANNSASSLFQTVDIIIYTRGYKDL